MRRYENVSKTVTSRVQVALNCDLCGKAGNPNSGWSERFYDVNDVTVEVSARRGEAYPEGGRTETKSFDICPECFHGVLVPFIESKGAQPRIEEQDF